VQVVSVQMRDFRTYARAEAGLGEGLTVVHGPNGAGKSNLLEALYFGLTGRSFRTRDRRELIRFGCSVGRVELLVSDEGSSHSLLASVSRAEGRRHLLDGEPAVPDVIASHRPSHSTRTRKMIPKNNTACRAAEPSSNASSSTVF